MSAENRKKLALFLWVISPTRSQEIAFCPAADVYRNPNFGKVRCDLPKRRAAC
jgi:hypothetical protein